MKTIMNEIYYDVPEVAKLLGLSQITVRNYMKNGRISAKKIGKSWHSKEIDIKLYLEKGITQESLLSLS